MQEVFGKIIEKLEKERKPRYRSNGTLMADNTNVKIDKAIEIVKQAAAEQNNGWIPCSDHLPKENGYYFVTQIVKSISSGKKLSTEKDYVEFSDGEWRRAKYI